MSSLTCISCRVGFLKSEFHRLHYKSDWHRYNLKRKVADLPPVSAEEFQKRVVAHKEEQNENEQPKKTFCEACRKSFNTENAYNNHLNSKKHLLNLSNYQPKSEKLETNQNQEESDTNSEEIEEVDSDEWDEDTENPISNNNCLFCPNHSRNMVKNLNHMSEAHSFFIPDFEYIVDLKGLLLYLGEKISQGFKCLWCNDKGKSFHSLESTQQHMIDKGHCKILHEGETLAEYADFYDYSSSYPDQEEGDLEEIVNIPVLDDSDYQLVLPSGSVIGHRTLLRYYKQHINPNRTVVAQQKKINRILATYKSLGWKQSQTEIVAKKARDIQFMKRLQQQYHLKLGVKANKLQKHFRPQVNF